MKRVGNLMERICELENIVLAAHKAFRGKRDKAQVRDFSANFTDNIQQLHSELLSGEIQVGNYHYFKIFDPKERLICAAPIKERILHHAIMNICHPYFDRRLIYDTYATRPQKGVYQALERVKRKMEAKKYFAKLDVRKYYDSIDHEILKKQLRRIFKDEKLLNLFDRIIDSYAVTPGKGLPIGNLTSQYFANIYLSDLDHYMKEDVGVPTYVRYMDDVLLLGDSVAEIKDCADKFVAYASARLSLTIKPPLIGLCREGVGFLGYKVQPSVLYLNGRSKRRYRHKLLGLERARTMGVLADQEYGRKITPLVAFTRHAQALYFRQSCMKLIRVVS